MIIFDNDEAEYLRWVKAYPTGFVINAVKMQSQEAPYMMHRADCWTIATNPAGNFTTTGYKKICSLDKQELIDWWRKYSSKEYRACKTCKP